MGLGNIIFASIWLIISFIPFCWLIKNWKKSNLFIKALVIVPFLLVLYFSYGFIIFSTPLYRPIYKEIGIPEIKLNETYEFSSFFLLTDYLTGFEIVSEQGCAGYISGPWPQNTYDAEVIVENDEIDKGVTEIVLNNRSYVAFNCWGDRGINHYDFGKLIKVKPFKVYHFKYNFKTLPPDYIKSIHLKVEDSGYNEFWAWSPLIHIANLTVVYVPLLIYFIVTKFLLKRKEKFKKR